jgi:coatomer subunit alpha
MLMSGRQIALHFVQDKTTRFDLAIECGNLDVALETARAIDRPECWNRLAQQALKQGNHKVREMSTLHLAIFLTLKCKQIVEKAYQQTKSFDRLSFLYLATGSTDKLAKMQKIAESRGDQMSRFHNALYAGDVEGRINVLRDVGLRKFAFSEIVSILRCHALCSRFIGISYCQDKRIIRSRSGNP